MVNALVIITEHRFPSLPAERAAVADAMTRPLREEAGTPKRTGI
jgi:hypothetical protein